MYKARVALTARIIMWVMNLHSKSYFIRKAKILRENNFADVDLEF